MNAKKHFLILGLVGTLFIFAYGQYGHCAVSSGDFQFLPKCTKSEIATLLPDIHLHEYKNGEESKTVFTVIVAAMIGTISQASWVCTDVGSSSQHIYVCQSKNPPQSGTTGISFDATYGKINCRYTTGAIYAVNEATPLPSAKEAYDTCSKILNGGSCSKLSACSKELFQDAFAKAQTALASPKKDESPVETPIIKDFDGDGILDDDDNCPEQYDPTNACGEHGDICDPEVDVSCSEAVPPGGGGCSLMGGDHSHSLSLSWAVAIGLALLLVVRRRSESDYS